MTGTDVYIKQIREKLSTKFHILLRGLSRLSVCRLAQFWAAFHNPYAKLRVRNYHGNVIPTVLGPLSQIATDDVINEKSYEKWIYEVL